VVVKVGGKTTLILVVTVTPLFALATASKLTESATELLVGAVYRTEVFVTIVKVPHPVPAHPEPVRGFHVTPELLVSFPKIALNWID
jgi:hypothetical protein